MHELITELLNGREISEQMNLGLVSLISQKENSSVIGNYTVKQRLQNSHSALRYTTKTVHL